MQNNAGLVGCCTSQRAAVQEQHFNCLTNHVLWPTALQGVSVVARLSRNLEELALVERRLDELPYPNLRLVQAG